MKYFLFIVSCLLLFSCKKLITVDTPVSELPGGDVYNSDALADATVADIYYVLGGYYTGSSLAVINDLTADELTAVTSSPYTAYANNAIQPADVLILSTWREFYKAIYRANAVLEGLATATKISADKRTQLIGEAKFLRAFCYYYLVNNWGDVPLITTTDVAQTALAFRAPAADIYQQIMSDLQSAVQQLPEAYSSNEKVRANKWAATAMLARVSLQWGNWVDAAANASLVINSGVYLPLSSPDSVFLKNSRSTILQIWLKDGYTFAAQGFLPVNGTYSTFALTTDLMNGFEPGDQRKDKWTGTFTYAGSLYNYPCKYKKNSANYGADAEYLMVLRIAEQYFIRAEARCQLNDMAGAMADLNEIRHRAGLTDLPADTDKETCLLTIEKERRTEMFTEWGDRWLSLKYTGRINTIMTVKKLNWDSTKALYPIPQQERERDPNLTQNKGYQ